MSHAINYMRPNNWRRNKQINKFQMRHSMHRFKTPQRTNSQAGIVDNQFHKKMSCGHCQGRIYLDSRSCIHKVIYQEIYVDLIKTIDIQVFSLIYRWHKYIGVSFFTQLIFFSLFNTNFETVLYQVLDDHSPFIIHQNNRGIKWPESNGRK